jgi:hypothetical protein
MTTRSLAAAFILAALTAGCTATKTGIAGNSTSTQATATTTPAATTTAPASGLDLSAAGAKSRALPIPTDLSYVLPTKDDLASSDAFFTGAGNFTAPVAVPIPAGSDTLPWAASTLGGVEHTYRFDVDTSAEFGLHQVTMTVKSLVFDSDRAALDALKARQEMLGKTATRASYPFASASLQIRYISADPSVGVSGITSVRGPVLVEVAIQDADTNLNWGGEAAIVMEGIIEALSAQHSSLQR